MTPREALRTALAPHVTRAGGARALLRRLGLNPSGGTKALDTASVGWLLDAARVLGLRVELVVDAEGQAQAVVSE